MDLSQIHEDALSEKVVCLPWQVVPVVTIWHVPFTGELYFDMKVLLMDGSL